MNLREIIQLDSSVLKEAETNELKNFQREHEKYERRKKVQDEPQNPNEPSNDVVEHEKKKAKPKICDVPTYRIKMARIEKIRQNDRAGIMTLMSILKGNREKDTVLFNTKQKT
jgi:hypothetical protein